MIASVQILVYLISLSITAGRLTVSILDYFVLTMTCVLPFLQLAIVVGLDFPEHPEFSASSVGMLTTSLLGVALLGMLRWQVSGTVNRDLIIRVHCANAVEAFNLRRNPPNPV